LKARCNNPTKVFRSRARLGLVALSLAFACFVLAGHRSGAAEPFLVIVNAANPVSSMSVRELSTTFMKKVARWPHGDEVTPVDLKDTSAVRESFSRRIHEKSTAAVKAYWQKMIFSGRDVPPSEKSTSAEVVAYVRANRGAIGYVAADTALGAGVKALKVTP
jgi:ABC-type phosphate transport system substrate-binding protein